MSIGDEQSQKSPPETGATVPATRTISEVLSRGADALPPLPVDESAAALEARLQKELDGRQEDRFYAFFAGTILIDMAMFQHLPWIGTICIFILEIIFLTGLAKRLGNEFVTILLSRLFHRALSWIGKDEKD
jgi:hypothetical protein